ncbi:hypothetical protein GCM10027188_29800 [Lysobacter humi (ex Lee et al. 2017)]
MAYRLLGGGEFAALATLALLGVVGLVLATAARFPVSTRVYVVVWLLLAPSMLGVLLALPFLALMVSLATMSSQHILVAVAVFAGLVTGPLACTIHFLVRSRCAPNNSSKPTPLRGAA